MSAAVAHQLGGDPVTVFLVADRDAAEGVAGLRVECFEQARKSGPAGPVHLPVMCVYYHFVDERQRKWT